MTKGERWDIPTRLFHWLLVVAVTLNLFFLEEGGDNHEWAGYIAAGLVIARGLWFFRSKRPSSNWLAIFVYIGMWGLILGLGATGFMLGLEEYWGEDWLEDLHKRLSQSLEVLIVLHLVGITLDTFRYRRHTWASMIVGERRDFR